MENTDKKINESFLAVAGAFLGSLALRYILKQVLSSIESMIDKTKTVASDAAKANSSISTAGINTLDEVKAAYAEFLSGTEGIVAKYPGKNKETLKKLIVECQAALVEVEKASRSLATAKRKVFPTTVKTESFDAKYASFKRYGLVEATVEPSMYIFTIVLVTSVLSIAGGVALSIAYSIYKTASMIVKKYMELVKLPAKIQANITSRRAAEALELKLMKEFLEVYKRFATKLAKAQAKLDAFEKDIDAISNDADRKAALAKLNDVKAKFDKLDAIDDSLQDVIPSAIDYKVPTDKKWVNVKK